MKALQEEEHFEIPMTSLIDVVFLLLIFFLVATNFNRNETEHSIVLPDSEAGERPTQAPSRLLVNIRGDGTLIVNGSVMTEESLRSLVTDFAAAYPERPAVIRADAKVTYQAVMKVFGICRSGGVQSINLPVLDPDGK